MNPLDLLTEGNLMPHGYCLVWRPDLLGMHVGGDLFTALSYFLIPFALIHLIRQRKDLAFNWVFVMFAAFITLCGITHIVSVLNIWHGYYFLEGVTKVATGLVSIATALMIWRMMPQFLELPSTETLTLKNAELARVEQTLRETNQNLEIRVGERTRELERLATIDSLTGALRRKELLESLERDLRRTQRLRGKLCLLIIDFDDLTSINEHYGFAAADRAMSEAVGLFRQLSAQPDKVGRLAGDQFAIIATESDLDKSAQLAERIRNAVSNIRVDTDVGALKLSCSIGVTEYAGEESIERLINTGLRTLDRAKADGKNMVAVNNR